MVTVILEEWFFWLWCGITCRHVWRQILRVLKKKSSKSHRRFWYVVRGKHLSLSHGMNPGTEGLEKCVCNLATHVGFIFSNKRNLGSLVKWLLLGLGQEIYMMRLGHLVARESTETIKIKNPTMIWVYQSDAGASYKSWMAKARIVWETN